MFKLAAPIALLTLLAAVSVADAQTSSTTNPDLQFAAKAASSGHAEVSLGRIAIEKSQREDIRQFARRMVDDHTRANMELAQLAQHQHLRLPRAAEGKDAEAIKRLTKLSGNEFDQAYASEMVKDHREDVQMFENEAQHGEVAPIRALAEKTLPMLREHLQLAEELQKNQGEEKAQVPGTMPEKAGNPE